MALGERLRTDLITAQKAGDSFRAETLRFIIAQCKNREIDKRGKGDTATLADAEIIEVLQREAKKRREAATLFTSGGRAELARKESEECALIETYLPAQMTEAEIKDAVIAIAAKHPGDFKIVMKEAMAALRGKADGRLVAEAVKTVTE